MDVLVHSERLDHSPDPHADPALAAGGEAALLPGRPPVYAHRGYSSQQPEMTVAAYRAAIDWAAERQVPLGLECDVQLSADEMLVCLHDLTLDRTAGVAAAVADTTLAELTSLDFGSWWLAEPREDQRKLTTLPHLLSMVAAARASGHEITVAVETKHPNPHGLDVDAAVARLLKLLGWDGPGSPVRIISFSAAALALDAVLLPGLPLTLLFDELGEWADGSLPAGVTAAGPSLAVLRADPGYVERAHAHGHEVHVWTVNDPADIAWCTALGVDAITTDYPHRLWQEADHAYPAVVTDSTERPGRRSAAESAADARTSSAA